MKAHTEANISPLLYREGSKKQGSREKGREGKNAGEQGTYRGKRGLDQPQFPWLGR